MAISRDLHKFMHSTLTRWAETAKEQNWMISDKEIGEEVWEWLLRMETECHICVLCECSPKVKLPSVGKWLGGQVGTFYGYHERLHDAIYKVAKAAVMEAMYGLNNTYLLGEPVSHMVASILQHWLPPNYCFFLIGQKTHSRCELWFFPYWYCFSQP